jgi:hypothetical protein
MIPEIPEIPAPPAITPAIPPAIPAPSSTVPMKDERFLPHFQF